MTEDLRPRVLFVRIRRRGRAIAEDVRREFASQHLTSWRGGDRRPRQALLAQRLPNPACRKAATFAQQAGISARTAPRPLAELAGVGRDYPCRSLCPVLSFVSRTGMRGVSAARRS
jgi:hypothetical protein